MVRPAHENATEIRQACLKNVVWVENRVIDAVSNPLAMFPDKIRWEFPYNGDYIIFQRFLVDFHLKSSPTQDVRKM